MEVSGSRNIIRRQSGLELVADSLDVSRVRPGGWVVFDCRKDGLPLLRGRRDGVHVLVREARI